MMPSGLSIDRFALSFSMNVYFYSMYTVLH